MPAVSQAVSGSLRFVWLYLLASPLFWLLDVTLGWGFRVAFIEQEAYKALYYAVLTAGGILCYLRPGLTAIIALLESSVNLALHIISFALPIFTLSDHVLQERPVSPVFTLQHLLGFLLVGVILLLSFNRALAQLKRH